MTAPRIDWKTLLPLAADIVRSYSTPVTLRQLHYRLVSADVGYPNTTVAYKALSSRTAEARRQGWFPRLHDRTRQIHRPWSWDGPAQALDVTAYSYRLDRTAGQAVNIVIGVEKAGLLAQLSRWFDDYGVPVIALGGYSSQGFVDDVADELEQDGRRAVLIYAGDFDASGEDIDRDFIARCGGFADVRRVALSAEQVDEMALPPNPGKSTDSRSRKFIERHGELVQVELDAVPPDVLRQLYLREFFSWWDDNAYEHVRAEEERDRLDLSTIAASIAGGDS